MNVSSDTLARRPDTPISSPPLVDASFPCAQDASRLKHTKRSYTPCLCLYGKLAYKISITPSLTPFSKPSALHTGSVLSVTSPSTGPLVNPGESPVSTPGTIWVHLCTQTSRAGDKAQGPRPLQ